MNKEQLLEELKQVQLQYYSDDYYFSMNYWDAVEDLIAKAETEIHKWK